MAGTGSTFPFLFQGMEYDVPSGLYHAGSNYYSPQLTRPASAAGPVGAVVGALTGLGFLFADLFGGGPDIPRELRLPAHSPEGLMRAGVTDLVNQESEGAPTSNTLPRIQIPFLHRPGWGYNYCGAGSIPGDPTDPTDKCCKQHDDCYAKAGLSAQNVNKSHPGARRLQGSSQVRSGSMRLHRGYSFARPVRTPCSGRDRTTLLPLRRRTFGR